MEAREQKTNTRSFRPLAMKTRVGDIVFLSPFLYLIAFSYVYHIGAGSADNMSRQSFKFTFDSNRLATMETKHRFQNHDHFVSSLEGVINEMNK